MGARNQLAELSIALFSTAAQKTIQQDCADKPLISISFPPRSPHFGGLWEAAVQSANVFWSQKYQAHP